jgi:hypothetical protein
MTAPLPDLEDIYERLAVAIDDVGCDKAALYLAKVVLLLAHRLDDRQAVLAALDSAAKDL